MTDRLRIAILGTGMIVEKAHIPAVLANPRARLVALYGRDNDNTARLHQQAGTGLLLHDLDGVFNLPELDAVIIALPNFLHRQAVELAARRGVAVLCEKPLAANIEDARAMVSVMQSVNKMLAVSLPRRWRPSLRRMDALRQSGFFGDIIALEVRMNRRAGIPGMGSWFTRRDQSGGGVLADLGPHVLDMAMWLCGSTQVGDLDSRIGALHGPQGLGLGNWGTHRLSVDDCCFDVDDFAWLRWTSGTGASIHCEMSWATYGPDENRVRIVGSKGGADYWPEINPQAPLTIYHYDRSGGVADAVESLPPDHNDMESAWCASVDDFIAAVLEGHSPAVTGATALLVSEVIDAAYRLAG